VTTNPQAQPPLEPIRITTVKAAELRPEITQPKSSGSTLFVGQHLDVQAVVQNSGAAKLKESGALKIDFQPHEFDLVDGSMEAPFVVDKSINWKLRAKSETKSGHVGVTIASPGKDENDMVAQIIKPSESISVRIKNIPRYRSYIGFPSVLIEADVAVEAELGAKVRLFNISRKGIPFYVVMSGAFGVYNIITSIEDEDPDALEPYTLGTLSLAIPLGPISLQAGSGLNFDFSDEELSLHVAPGIELNLGRFSIQGGIRYVYEKDLPFFLVQMKF
jgi:hypothetical protein